MCVQLLLYIDCWANNHKLQNHSWGQICSNNIKWTSHSSIQGKIKSNIQWLFWPQVMRGATTSTQYAECLTATNPLINTMAYDHQHMTIYPKAQKVSFNYTCHFLCNCCIWGVTHPHHIQTHIHTRQPSKGRALSGSTKDAHCLTSSKNCQGQITLHIL